MSTLQKSNLTTLLAVLIFLVITSHVYAIGITPARWPMDLKENGSLQQSLTYTLGRPDTRYSKFITYQPAGLDVSITGCNVSAGVEYLEDGSIRIDWQNPAVSSQGDVKAYVDLDSPDSWQSPVDPGYSYTGDMVIHIEDPDPESGIGFALGTVSQLKYYRNYALKGNVSNLQNEYNSNTPVQFNIDVVDFYSTELDLKYFDFSYSVDWESDGIFDETFSGIRMTDELGNTDGESLCAGFKYKTLDLEHSYNAPGEYMVTVELNDMETTSMQIPLTVVPEPATILLLGFGGVMLRKK